MRPNKNYRQDKLPSRDYYELRNHLFWISGENWFFAIPLTLACVFLVVPQKKWKTSMLAWNGAEHGDKWIIVLEAIVQTAENIFSSLSNKHSPCVFMEIVRRRHFRHERGKIKINFTRMNNRRPDHHEYDFWFYRSGQNVLHKYFVCNEITQNFSGLLVFKRFVWTFQRYEFYFHLKLSTLLAFVTMPLTGIWTAFFRKSDFIAVVPPGAWLWKVEWIQFFWFLWTFELFLPLLPELFYVEGLIV